MEGHNWAIAAAQFIAWMRTDKSRWYVGPPSGVLYCDDEAEAESWYGQEVERPVRADS